MIRIYCRHKEGNSEICPECKALMEYAALRLSHCKYGDSKSACRRCLTHCYRPDMRDRIRKVMRYSGPRMIFFTPVEFFKHYFCRN